MIVVSNIFLNMIFLSFGKQTFDMQSEENDVVLTRDYVLGR